MKRFANLIFLLLLLALLSACGSSVPSDSQPAPAPDPTNGGAEEGQKISAQLQVYYSDANLEQLEAEQREISYQPDQSGDKYVQALSLLGMPTEQGHEPLWENFDYHTVSFSDGTLTIDASGENQYNLGATGEALAMEALKRTMFQFSEVEQIVILVDGKPADSLMGHADISQPLTR
ncbi:GerMN domain-containing protein [Brevibacillus humidisoli]|uniref:GerMN domain-containing protein n=1 Tax=Brevibacillus humidisoli TaxID=2895522 RepID=UPI001E2D3787|nr:GerMN domain-containing protein [Brevibacillus humidisoli]UFJ40927.1 GerMN domain-containing protein [Brevibacillus humidisoli]